MATVTVFAADSYVMIKAVEKTPATIAGPFKSKEEAMKAKEKECSKASTTQPTKPATPASPTRR